MTAYYTSTHNSRLLLLLLLLQNIFLILKQIKLGIYVLAITATISKILTFYICRPPHLWKKYWYTWMQYVWCILRKCPFFNVYQIFNMRHKICNKISLVFMYTFLWRPTMLYIYNEIVKVTYKYALCDMIHIIMWNKLCSVCLFGNVTCQ